MTISKAMDDERMFGQFFVGLSWAFWRVALGVLFGLPLSAEEQVAARRNTGRMRLFNKLLRELWLAIGRRRGKSRVCALIAVFVACVVDHSAHHVPGETGVVLLCAPSQRQARVLLGYIVGFLHAVPILSRMVVRETELTVELSNNISIEVRSSNFKTVRGFTVVAAIVDEIAFLPAEDSAIPDTKLLNALRPAMASVVEEFAAILKQYGVRKVVGDHYAAEYPRELFRSQGIGYEPSRKTRSELYVEFLTLLNSACIELPRHERLLAQLRNLERRVARSGHESIDHVPGAHDDLANAVAGALVLAAAAPSRKFFMPTTIEVQIGQPSAFRDPYANLGSFGFEPERWWHK